MEKASEKLSRLARQIKKQNTPPKSTEVVAFYSVGNGADAEGTVKKCFPDTKYSVRHIGGGLVAVVRTDLLRELSGNQLRELLTTMTCVE